MSLTTCAVSCLMFGPDGEPEVGARFEAKLDRPEVAAGFIVPDRVIGTTDVSGVCVLNLWPNQLGATESVYIVKMTSPTGRTVTVTAVVPDSGTANLHDITTLPPYPGKSDGALVLEAAVSAGQVALAAADSATNSKAAAETAQAAAETAQAASELARDTAQSSQTAAASSQSAAATSATAAAGSASAAAGSATAAASSATAAQTAKTGAESARDTAQAAATTATGAASTASSAATTATGAASTATTKASEASASAFAAQASESNAAASEAAAAGSAATASTKAGEAAASAAAAATFDPALYVPRSGNATLAGPLSVPASATGEQVPQAQETAMLATTQFGLRNRFINPDFSIWQNGLSFTSNAGITYCAAQWMVADGGAGLNVARSFADSDACVIKNGAAGHTTGWLAQPIESYGIRDLTGANAVGQITVSIDIICTAAQTGSIAVWRAGAEDNFTSPVLISSSSWTHPGGGARQRTSATFTLPADAKNGIVIYFNHNAIASGQHIRFARAQCEAGPRATQFAARPPALEMAFCQRYYEVGQAAVWQGQQSSYRANAYVNFNTWKRVAPLMTYQVAEQNGYGSYDVNYIGQQGFNFHVICTTSTADGRAGINWQANARLM